MGASWARELSALRLSRSDLPRRLIYMRLICVSLILRRLICMTAQPDPASEWWTTSDVAAYLGLRVATVSAYRTRGQMPQPDMTVGRTHVWRPYTIISWHEARKRIGVGGRPSVK